MSSSAKKKLLWSLSAIKLNQHEFITEMLVGKTWGGKGDQAVSVHFELNSESKQLDVILTNKEGMVVEDIYPLMCELVKDYSRRLIPHANPGPLNFPHYAVGAALANANGLDANGDILAHPDSYNKGWAPYYVLDGKNYLCFQVNQGPHYDNGGYLVIGQPEVRPCTAAQVVAGGNKGDRAIKLDNRTLITFRLSNGTRALTEQTILRSNAVRAIYSHIKARFNKKEFVTVESEYRAHIRKLDYFVEENDGVGFLTFLINVYIKIGTNRVENIIEHALEFPLTMSPGDAKEAREVLAQFLTNVVRPTFDIQQPFPAALFSKLLINTLGMAGFGKDPMNTMYRILNNKDILNDEDGNPLFEQSFKVLIESNAMTPEHWVSACTQFNAEHDKLGGDHWKPKQNTPFLSRYRNEAVSQLNVLRETVLDCVTCGKSGHLTKDCPSNPMSANANMKKICARLIVNATFTKNMKGDTKKIIQAFRNGKTPKLASSGNQTGRQTVTSSAPAAPDSRTTSNPRAGGGGDHTTFRYRSRGCPANLCAAGQNHSAHANGQCSNLCAVCYESTEGTHADKVAAGRACQNTNGEHTGKGTIFCIAGLVLRGKMGKLEFADVLPGNNSFTTGHLASKTGLADRVNAVDDIADFADFNHGEDNSDVHLAGGYYHALSRQ